MRPTLLALAGALVACVEVAPEGFATLRCDGVREGRLVRAGEEFSCPAEGGLTWGGGTVECPTDCELFYRWRDQQRYAQVPVARRRPHALDGRWVYKFRPRPREGAP